MNGGKKQVTQAVRQQVAKAAGDIGQGTLDEAKNVASVAATQITGTDRIPMREQAPAIGQSAPSVPNPSQFGSTDQYRANLEQETKKRINELKVIIEEEGKKATMQRQQEEQAWQQAQVEAMQKDEREKQEREQKGGIIAGLGRAAKRIAGRKGHVQGQGKSEKGRAAKG